MSADVINIGDLAIRRKDRWAGFTTPGECKHLRLTLDDNGDTVRCEDCKVYVSAYWALKLLAMQFQRQQQELASRRASLDAETAEKRTLIATRRLDKAWRSRTMVPACPHCNEAIFPEDGFGGTNVNRDIALARRAATRRTEEGNGNG